MIPILHTDHMMKIGFIKMEIISCCIHVALARLGYMYVLSCAREVGSPPHLQSTSGTNEKVQLDMGKGRLDIKIVVVTLSLSAKMVLVNFECNLKD